MNETIQTTPESPAAEKTTLDIQDILKILPHRYPMLLIDRVVDLTRKERIVAIKNVSITSHFLPVTFRTSRSCRGC